MIDELRTEHLDLSMSFDRLSVIDMSSMESRSQLRDLKSAFLSHMKRENDTVYPELREASFNNGKLQQTLDWFTRDLARISAVLILFLDRFAEGGSQRDYNREYSRLSKIFNALIRQEENIIFSEYLKIHPYSEAA